MIGLGNLQEVQRKNKLSWFPASLSPLTTSTAKKSLWCFNRQNFFRNGILWILLGLQWRRPSVHVFAFPGFKFDISPNWLFLFLSEILPLCPQMLWMTLFYVVCKDTKIILSNFLTWQCLSYHTGGNVEWPCFYVICKDIHTCQNKGLFVFTMFFSD